MGFEFKATPLDTCILKLVSFFKDKKKKKQVIRYCINSDVQANVSLVIKRERDKHVNYDFLIVQIKFIYVRISQCYKRIDKAKEMILKRIDISYAISFYFTI